MTTACLEPACSDHGPPVGGPSALVLSGGGALGAYEVGVLKALVSRAAPGEHRKPFDPQILCGTSVGAFNAAFLAAQTDVPFARAVARLEEVWLKRIANRGRGNGVFRYRFDPRYLADPLAMLRSPVRTWARCAADLRFLSTYTLGQATSWWRSRGEPFADRLAELVDLSAIISTAPLLRTIRETIDFDRLRSSPREFSVQVTNWTDSTLRNFSNRDLDRDSGAEVLRASASLPGFFPLVEIDGEAYADGSVIMNTPLMPAVTAGAKEIHAVFLYPPFWRGVTREDTVNALFQSMVLLWRVGLYTGMLGIDYVNRLEGTTVGDKVRLPSQGQIELYLYYPSQWLGMGASSFFDFRYSNVRRLIEQGFESTRLRRCNTLACQPLDIFPEALFRNFENPFMSTDFLQTESPR